MNLFDGQKTQYRLFDSMRLRFIPNISPRLFDQPELFAANEYFVKSSCTNLQWKSESEQPRKVYRIER